VIFIIAELYKNLGKQRLQFIRPFLYKVGNYCFLQAEKKICVYDDSRKKYDKKE
jgi:hypothetical protein